MVTKAKPAADVEPEAETKETVEITDDALTEKIKAVVESMLPGGETTETTTTETETETSKPLTAREEEARTHNIVSEAIKAFKDEFAGEKKEPEKKEPETQPGKKATRWVESFLWGKE
jgi:hypothetical protein